MSLKMNQPLAAAHETLGYAQHLAAEVPSFNYTICAPFQYFQTGQMQFTSCRDQIHQDERKEIMLKSPYSQNYVCILVPTVEYLSLTV